MSIYTAACRVKSALALIDTIEQKNRETIDRQSSYRSTAERMQKWQKRVARDGQFVCIIDVCVSMWLVCELVRVSV